MTRLGLIAVILSALLASAGVLAAGVQHVAAVSAPQQEEEPEIEPYPGETEPDCE